MTLYTNVRIIVIRNLLDFDILYIIINHIAKRSLQLLPVLSHSSFRCLFPFLLCLGGFTGLFPFEFLFKSLKIKN